MRMVFRSGNVRVQSRPVAKRLDISDALVVKDVYAPKRKQGEREH